MKEFHPESIRERIRHVAVSEGELSDPVARDVAFHMTDWLTDLDAYRRFCSEPSALSEAEVNQLLTQFLVHVPNHLAAAAKLYTGIPVTDVFGVGATSQEENGS
jgi:hypothetical protein